jgi:hypothetical protein
LSQSPQEHILLLRHHTELGRKKSFYFSCQQRAVPIIIIIIIIIDTLLVVGLVALLLRCVTLFYGTAAETGDFMPLVCLIIFYYYSISYLWCVIAGIEENHSLSFPITRPSLFISLFNFLLLLLLFYSLLLRITFNESF